ncbi:unnamed protein product [Euphydryas editha]|uniref:Nudix hydrolase domain-containing protein n=1 Tax=Euphydryas editha TaxID=104508 RepID=A0AAU9U531_EUPED|nr:unnamed protein product [Euphydryas editha]
MSLLPEILLSTLARQSCISKLKDLPALVTNPGEPQVKAAVLLPLFVQDGEVHILYTLRSSNLNSHSGQVSFPGGKLDENENVIDAALRESYEEIGVRPESVDVWCEMAPIQGRDKTMLITPVVGFIENLSLNNLIPNIDEVDEIFSEPMSLFCDKTKHAHLKHERYMLPVFLGKHKIWGITGLITHIFLQCFLPSDLYQTDFGRQRYKLEELMPSKL